MEKLLIFYESKLESKEKKINEYVDERDSNLGFKSFKREKEYHILRAEKELLIRFIDDLLKIR